MTSRRDLLQLFLGAPLALAACKRSGSTPRIEGELVDEELLRGHRVRDEGRVPLLEPSTDEPLYDAIVIGGGVAGLAARERMGREGLSVLLVEADSVVGGTAKGGQNAGGAHPWGAHYVTAPLVEAKPIVRLLEELGVIVGRSEDGRDVVLAEEAVVRAPEERLFHLGRWEEGLYPRAGASAEDLAELERFRAHVRLLAARRDAQGRRAFIAPLHYASRDAEVLELDRVTMGTWLDREGYRSARLRWLVDYACRDDFGLRVEHTSAWAALFYFAARSGPDGEPRAVIPWPEGNARLVTHLARKGRGSIEHGVLCRRVGEVGEECRVVVEDRQGSRRTRRARRVVLAVPAYVARRMVDGLAERDAGFEAPSYGSWVVANLVVDPAFARQEAPLAWDNVLHRSPSLGYVNARHQVDERTPALALTHYYALCDTDPKAVREKLLAVDHTSWSEVVLSDLEAAHPRIREHVRRIDVLRWGHAMVRPVPGLRARCAEASAARPFGRVHVAHSELSGVALFEEAYVHGLRAGEEVLAALGRHAPSDLDA